MRVITPRTNEAAIRSPEPAQLPRSQSVGKGRSLQQSLRSQICDCALAADAGVKHLISLVWPVGGRKGCDLIFQGKGVKQR